MHIKSIVAGAALAVIATVGSAAAADQFVTLEGLTVDALTPQEMGVVTGADGARASLHITGGFSFAGGDMTCGPGCHHFLFPGAAGASDVVSLLPGGVQPAQGSGSNTFFVP